MTPTFSQLFSRAGSHCYFENISRGTSDLIPECRFCQHGFAGAKRPQVSGNATCNCRALLPSRGPEPPSGRQLGAPVGRCPLSLLQALATSNKAQVEQGGCCCHPLSDEKVQVQENQGAILSKGAETHHPVVQPQPPLTTGYPTSCDAEDEGHNGGSCSPDADSEQVLELIIMLTF